MADQVLSLSGDISRKLASRRGAFGSAAPRAVGASAAVAAAAVAVPSPSHDSNSVTAAHAASAVPVKDSDRASSVSTYEMDTGSAKQLRSQLGFANYPLYAQPRLLVCCCY